jgi:undecaprenyl-diphosphatase
LSTFWFLIIRDLLNRKWYWLWLWAFIIGYAQIFVGVHFPGDIITGAILGIGFGYLNFYLFNRWTNREEIEVADLKETKVI